MAQIIMDKKRITIIAVVIFVFILFFSIKLYERSDKTEDIPDTIAELEEEEVAAIPEESQPSMVYVDIKGAVVKPGVYKLEDEKRVLDVIQLAGGFQTDADQTKINLAARVTDEMVLYIPRIGEVLQSQTGLPTNSEMDDGKININTATSLELESLPGIGAAKAASIITFREQNGPFKEIEDLVNVTGIGDKSFEKLKDQIKVR